MIQTNQHQKKKGMEENLRRLVKEWATNKMPLKKGIVTDEEISGRLKYLDYVGCLKEWAPNYSVDEPTNFVAGSWIEYSTLLKLQKSTEPEKINYLNFISLAF